MPRGVPNKRYSPEFKIMVVKTMQNKRLSCLETARRFEIPNGDKTVAKWERIYLEGGEEGLRIERRGRACSAGGTRKGKPLKLEKETEEDIISEVQYLRAENAYLKKLNALVAERVRQEKNHK